MLKHLELLISQTLTLRNGKINCYCQDTGAVIEDSNVNYFRYGIIESVVLIYVLSNCNNCHGSVKER